MPSATDPDEDSLKTRVWVDRAPYDVEEPPSHVERVVAHFLENAHAGVVDGPKFLHCTMSKNLKPVALVVSKISAIEPRG